MNQFPHSVRDEYGMECPACQRDTEIRIWATQAIKVVLVPDGTRDYGGGHDTEWEDNSQAECGECGYEGQVADFRIVSEEAKERQLVNQWRYEVQCCETKLGFEAWKAERDGGNPVQTPETPANSHSVSLEANSEWFIVGPGHMYWSVDEGWVSAFTKATIFDNKARQPLDHLGTDFPTDGKWEQNPVTVRKSGIAQSMGLTVTNLPTVEEPNDSAGYPHLGMKDDLVIYAWNDPKDGAGVPGLPWLTSPGVGKSSVILQDTGMSMSMWKAKEKEHDVAALMNNILWHLENCASEPDGGGAAYMAKELAKLIGRKEQPMGMYKKYILFSYDTYYPGGGMSDLFASYETLEEAQAEAKTVHPNTGIPKHGNIQIVDRDTWAVVEED
jgi:Zn ribbon nucleic-acid-binding protein